MVACLPLVLQVWGLISSEVENIIIIIIIIIIISIIIRILDFGARRDGDVQVLIARLCV